MRKRAGIAACGAAAAVVLAGSASAGSQSRDVANGSGGTGTGSGHHRTGKGYVNPFKARRWYAGRIDMGVDYSAKRRTPMVAIGDAKVLGSQGRNTGWPGNHFIWYRLLNGDHAGNVVYVAEYMKKLVPRGTRVSAGQRIGVALRGADGIEIGWATRRGQPRAAPCYSEGMKTHSGKEMARFLRSLGAQTGDRPGRVPDEPSGKRC